MNDSESTSKRKQRVTIDNIHTCPLKTGLDILPV